MLTKLPVKASASEKFPSFYESTPEHPEQRAVQVVELGPPGEPGIVFLCTHLDYRPDERERMASAEVINRLAAKYGDRLMLLAGDLNATPDSDVIRGAGKALEDCRRRRQAASGRMTTARIVVHLSGRQACQAHRLRAVSAGRSLAGRRDASAGRAEASDHRPLLTVLLRVP